MRKKIKQVQMRKKTPEAVTQKQFHIFPKAPGGLTKYDGQSTKI